MRVGGTVWGGRIARFGLSLGILSLAASAAPAWALEGVGVSPTSQEVNVDPGVSHSGSLTVINDGTTDITYKVEVNDYTVTGERYQGSFNDTNASHAISPITWFALPQGNKTVKAGQQAQVPYTITPPVNATPGGHYAVVFIETVPPATAGGTVINRIQKIGSIFYIAVGGNVVKAGEVLDLTAPLLQLHSPITANLRVKNTGNVHFAMDGQSFLTNLFGHKTTPVSFHAEVLPGTTRSLPIKLASDSNLGLYKVTSEVKYLDHAQTLTRWVVLVPPITLAIFTLTLIVLIGLAVVGLVKKRKQTKQP